MHLLFEWKGTLMEPCFSIIILTAEDFVTLFLVFFKTYPLEITILSYIILILNMEYLDLNTKCSLL